MFSVLQSIKNLFNVSANPAQDRDDQYLADAADIYDLERRMREIDERGRSSAANDLTFSLGLR